MKTKIIYISGNELFEMAQIRAAFDEVRNTLGLDQDTILFGVPVDSDDAIATATESDCMTTVDDENKVLVDESVVAAEIISETPVEIVSEVNITPKPEFVSDVIEEESVPTGEHIDDSDEKIVPIMSVLATSAVVDEDVPETEDKVQDVVPAAEDAITESNDETQDLEVATEITEISVSEDNVVSEENNTEDESPEDNTTVSHVSVAEDDILDEEPPVTMAEKTLEELLESMTPLREDVANNTVAEDVKPVPEHDFVFDSDDTDATLEQLATEFIQNEDKITSPAKTEASGKISKLKNILPFKKVKREDNSMIGDLFGWAGIAANDEDFTVPGFFTAAKKQGA